MSAPSFCLKYKVLKPQPSIAVLAKSFRQPQTAQYLLAETPDRAVRKYRDQCSSIEHLLTAAEWRYDAGPQVAHCYFLQLLKPSRQTRGMQYEAYVEHVQVGLGEVSKLIVQESFYLLLESARGYQQLFSKFKRAAVGPSTIGLNVQGRCIVWAHPELSSFSPPADALSAEVDIIRAIIEEVSKKSEPLCQGMLTRLLEDTRRKQLTLSGFIDHVSTLAAAMKITLPQDLRYLVNQHNILRDVRNLKAKTQIQEPQKNRPQQTKTQRYRPIKTEMRENVFALTQTKPCIKRDHRMSDVNILQGTRVASSFESKQFLTEKNIARKKESYLSTNMSSFIANSDKKWPVRHHSKCTDEDGENSNKRLFSKSRERSVISKCKSSEGRNQSDINVIYAKPYDRLIFSEKDPADNSSRQKKPFVTYGHNSQFSDRANSFRHKQQFKQDTTKVYKSFVLEFGKRIDEKNKCIGEECEEHESSPNKEKSNDHEQSDCVNRSPDCLEDEVHVQYFLKANQWIKNLDSHQLWVESKLNTSITLGQERTTYLDDVKLEKLELLSRQMAISRLPQETPQPLFSQTIID